MLASDIPARFNIPFADAAGPGYIRPVPQASQIGIEDGAASLTDGFPPDTFTPVTAGGVPPFGQDFNGLLYQITAWNQWQAAGGPVRWDSTFSTAIGGYPQGATVMSAAVVGLFWLSLVDNNTSNPDTGGANWRAFSFGDAGGYGVTAGTAAAMTVTLAPTPTAYTTGMRIYPKAGTTNPAGGVTINLMGPSGLLGAKSIKLYDGSDPGAGLITAGMVLDLVYDGTNWVYANAPYGPTAAAGTNTGQLATTAFVRSTLLASAAYKYVGATSATPLTAFSYYMIDTRSAPVTLTLPASPTAGDFLIFADAFYTWGTNIVTLQRNGQTIMGQASDLTADADGIQFALVFDGSTWRLE